MGIQRWGYDGCMSVVPCPDGEYVALTDHERVVAELEQQVIVAEQVTVEQDREITRLRAELAAKSKDAARYRYIRDCTSADAVDLVTDWSDLELDQAIDSKMGEGNGR